MGTFADVDVRLIGNEGADSLNADNLSNIWTIAGADRGSLGSLNFEDVENLLAGSLADTFVFQPGS